MWKVLRSRRTVILWVEWSILQRTICGSYCTAGGQWYCGLNVVRYSERYVEDTAQQVESSIVGSMVYLTENSLWKLLHRRWTVGLWVECSVLQ